MKMLIFFPKSYLSLFLAAMAVSIVSTSSIEPALANKTKAVKSIFSGSSSRAARAKLKDRRTGSSPLSLFSNTQSTALSGALSSSFRSQQSSSKITKPFHNFYDYEHWLTKKPYSEVFIGEGNPADSLKDSRSNNQKLEASLSSEKSEGRKPSAVIKRGQSQKRKFSKYKKGFARNTRAHGKEQEKDMSTSALVATAAGAAGNVEAQASEIENSLISAALKNDLNNAQPLPNKLSYEESQNLLIDNEYQKSLTATQRNNERVNLSQRTLKLLEENNQTATYTHDPYTSAESSLGGARYRLWEDFCASYAPAVLFVTKKFRMYASRAFTKGNIDDAADLAQETMIKLTTNCATLTSSSNPIGYANKSLMNTARSYFGKLSKIQTTSIDSMDDVENQISTDTNTLCHSRDPASLYEAQQLILSAVKSLTAREADALLSRAIGMTVSETAESMKISTKRVNQLIAQVKDKLRSCPSITFAVNSLSD